MSNVVGIGSGSESGTSGEVIRIGHGIEQMRKRVGLRMGFGVGSGIGVVVVVDRRFVVFGGRSIGLEIDELLQR